MTYNDLLSQFNDITRDSQRHIFTAAQVDRFARRGLERLCAAAKYKLTGETINIVSGTGEYAATSEGHDVVRVEYDGEALRPIRRDDLRAKDSDWVNRTGYPRYYYLDEIYGSQRYPSVGLFEIPSTSLTDGLRMWYTGKPTAPSAASGATAVDIPDWAVGGVLFFMLYLAYSADTFIQNQEAAAVYKMLYEDIEYRLIKRARDNSPKSWVSGQPARAGVSFLNRMPERIVP